MKDMTAAFAYDLKDLDRDEWMSRVDDVCEEFGHFEPVGPNHSALLIDAGRTLLVSFESTPSVQKKNVNAAPFGWQFVKSHGWSSLTLMAHENQDWYRHPAVFGYFDRMIDDGFFDDFDHVLFYGSGAAAYAAAAFSVAAPGARVLAIQPQATLNTEHAGWDRRFPKARRLDFCSRFGYAPAMVETAQHVTIIHDPTIIEDAMHAQLFNGNNTTHLKCPYIGPNADLAFKSMDILLDIAEAAMSGSLTRHNFAGLWRERHAHMPYLRTLFHRLEIAEDHPRLLATLCRNLTAKTDRPMFAKKLAELEAQGVAV